MIRQLYALASACIVVANLQASAFGATTQPSPETCADNQTCAVELPGAVCADGTPFFMNVTPRTGATKLYIYLDGGGACWDATTCLCGLDGICLGGTAARLTRPDPWMVSSGWHAADEAANPIGTDYNVVEIPYCTGDLFLGNRVQHFGIDEKSAALHQVGYKDLTIALAAVKERFPNPESIVFMGSSAGGLGATFNHHQMRNTYPTTPLSVISDSGVPFKSPFVHRSGIDTVIAAWNVMANLPADYYERVPGPLDFIGILKYNSQRYPDDRFALISSYDDIIMNGFSVVLGTDYPLDTVRMILNDIVEHDLAVNQKVFYIPGNRHTFHDLPVRDVVSNGVNLGHWLSSMLEARADWIDRR